MSSNIREARKIVIIEGLPGAGKTSFINYIKFNYSFGIKTVPQIIYGRNKKRIDLKDYYIRNDIKKVDRALRFLRKNKLVFLDRGFLSTLAYAYASDKIFKKNKYRHYDDLINGFISSGDLIFPDIWIYIKIDPEISVLRKKRNRKKYYIWEDKKFLKIVDTFSLKWLSKNNQKVVIINGMNNYKKVLNDFKNIVNELIGQRNDKSK